MTYLEMILVNAGVFLHIPMEIVPLLMGFMKEKPSRNYGTSILNYLGIQTFLNFRFW